MAEELRGGSDNPDGCRLQARLAMDCGSTIVGPFRTA
jgi:hypothetical protein